MEAISREAFFELPLDEVEERTGVKMAEGGDEADYRERAWESYKQDISQRRGVGRHRRGQRYAAG